MKLTLVRKRARGGVDFSRAACRDGVGGDVDGATPPRVGPGAYDPSYAAVEPDETAIGFSRAGRPIGVGVGVGAASAGDEDGDGDVLELDPAGAFARAVAPRVTGVPDLARAVNPREEETARKARSIHWSPYDPVGVVNADP